MRYINLLVILNLYFVLIPQVLALPFEVDRPLYAGSRPLGMGNAFVAISDNAESGFWNPAGLIQCQGVRVFASTKTSNRESYAFDSKCVAYSYRNFGFFWGNKIALRVKNRSGVSGESPPKSGDTPDFNYYSLAYKLNSYFAAGASIKFKRRHPCGYYQFSGYDQGYDFGFLWKANSGSSGGILIQNLSSEKRWINIITPGVTHRFSNRSLLSLDSAILLNDRITLEPHIGWEWQITRQIALRAGMSDSYPTAGLGLRLFNLQVDYALIRDTRGVSHYLSGQLEL